MRILETIVLMEGSLRIIRFEGRPFWQARVYDKRKRGFVTKSLKTTDVAEAQAKAIQWWSEINPKIQADIPLAAGTIEATIDQYLEAQQRRVEAKEIKPGALRDMKAQLKPLLLYCKLQNLRLITDIKAWSLNNFIPWRRDESKLLTTGVGGILKPTSVNKGVREVRAFWKWVMAQRLADFDLDLKETPIRGEQVKDRNVVITDGDWKQIQQELNRVTFKARPSKRTQPIHLYYRRMFYTLVMVLVETGLRPQEATNIIRWSDFSVHRRPGSKSRDEFISACVIQVNNPDGKGSRAVVSHAGQLIQAFRKYADKWRQEQGFRAIKSDDLIFCFPRTNEPYSYSQLGLSFRRLMKQLNLDNKGYTLRSLRATYVTDQIAKGVSPYILARNTGHSIEVMRKHYEALGVQDIADALL